MIQRLTPDTGYLDPDVLNRSGGSQLVVAGGIVHWSGILAARSGPDGVAIPALDMAGQLEFIIDVLDRCLRAAGSDSSHLLAVTMFATDLPSLGQNLNLFSAWVGEHRPALTAVGVDRLAFPESLVEVAGCALQVAA